MGFDWKAFAAAFLDKQTEGIRERKKKPKSTKTNRKNSQRPTEKS